jgi:hypothetical protein
VALRADAESDVGVQIEFPIPDISPFRGECMPFYGSSSEDACRIDGVDRPDDTHSLADTDPVSTLYDILRAANDRCDRVLLNASCEGGIHSYHTRGLLRTSDHLCS